MHVLVNKPYFSSSMQQTILETVSSSWISGTAPSAHSFEKSFAKSVGALFATTTTSGTTGLHLAFVSLGISAGDEVLIPNLTIISCALAAIYQHATPILVDVVEKTAGINLLEAEGKISKKTKAILIVHLYGQPVPMQPVMAFAKRHNLLVIEDCSQAYGAKSDDQCVGSFGDAAVFSLYANKTITTGEGGIVLFKDERHHKLANKLKNLYHSEKTRFLHPRIGYNYRMSAILAALGEAQLKEKENILHKKTQIDQWYRNILEQAPYIELAKKIPHTTPVCWMFTLRVFPDAPFSAQELAKFLEKKDIETRFFFVPLHLQPALQPYLRPEADTFPISTDIANRGLYLPSGVGHTKEEIEYVANTVLKFLLKK
jgi:perosamine synthetase